MKDIKNNSTLSILSQYASRVNQIIYEIFILLGLYIYLRKIYPFLITNKNTNKNTNNLFIQKNIKSIIILYSLFAILIDWFIWNNATQSILFTGILIVYCNYNLNNLEVISTFVNITGSSFTQVKNIELSSPKCENIPAQQPSINEINLPYDLEDIKPYGIKPFDSKDSRISNKEIAEVYKSDNKYVSITDSAYASAILNDLYATPQYKNILDIPDMTDMTDMTDMPDMIV